MSIKFPSTRITNASGKVDKYLNLIYELKDEIEEVDIEFLMEFLDDLQSWKQCVEEIELKIKSSHNFNEMKDYIETNNENKELIIY